MVRRLRFLLTSNSIVIPTEAHVLGGRSGGIPFETEGIPPLRSSLITAIHFGRDDRLNMATYKTRAIILSSYPYREHDRIVSFYSDEYGRMEARARGARKIQSKLAGHLEQFIETELLLAHGKRWDILAGSRTQNAQPSIRNNIESIASASVCAQAVKIITKPLSNDARIFNLLKKALYILEREDISQLQSRALVGAFLWKLLAISGFAPELKNCINCRRESKDVNFSLEGGGILCNNCKNRDIFAISVNESVYKELLESNIASEKSFDIVTRYWSKIVDHTELKSLEFMKSVL
jgi:DNA repair protein RecO (recombination protein O)